MEERLIIIKVIHGEDNEPSEMQIVRIAKGEENIVYKTFFNRRDLRFGSPVVRVKPGPSEGIVV